MSSVDVESEADNTLLWTHLCALVVGILIGGLTLSNGDDNARAGCQVHLHSEPIPQPTDPTTEAE